MRNPSYIFSALLLLALWLLPVPMQAGEAETILEQANDAYANAEYERAAKLYQTVVDMGLESVPLYYNLANAAYKNNELARAILNYERAEKLEPGNEDVQFNLRLANMRLVDKVEIDPEFLIAKWGNEFVNSKSSSAWAKWALALIWISLLAAAAFLFVNRTVIKRIAFFGGIVFALCSLVSLGIGIQKRNLEQNSRYGIVMVPNAYVKSAPGTESTDLFIIHEGLKVRVMETTAGWVRVSLADGKLGWMETSQVAEI